MKKVLIATGVAVLALAMVAGAQGYAFNTNLTVGSTGADVVALQTWLISSGFSIPSIDSGAAAKGYFGAQTKAAVVAYQKANGIPATGFVGPLTRGKLNGSPVVAPVVSTTCPVGYICQPVNGQVPPTNTAPGVTAGTDGSVSVSDSSYVSSGQSLKKGDTKDVVAVRLQATAGAVAVSRLDVHFSVRPWLFFSQVTLKDASGKVLATKPLSSAADATEITVGSDYLVRFEGLNYVVTPGVNPDLAVGVTVLAATDKITDGMTVSVGIPTGAIRTVNGLGITDSIGGAAFPASSGSGERQFTLTSTGSKADITTRIGPASAATTRYQTISSSVSTNGVVLGVYGLKAANNSATLQEVAFTVQTDPNYGTVTQLISNVRLLDGSNSYGSTYTNGAFKFTNMNVNLAQDQWKDMTLVADIAATSSDVAASSTLDASTISAVDSNYNTATVAGVAAASATNDQTAANVKMTINAMSVGGFAVNYDTCVVTTANGPCVLYPFAMTYTLTNNSNNTLFVPTDVSLALGTTTSPTNASSTITSYRTQASQSGDTSAGYAIQSGGTRTFTVEGALQKSSNTVKAESLTINAIKFSTVAGSNGSSIAAGLESLQAKKTF